MKTRKFIRWLSLACLGSLIFVVALIYAIFGSDPSPMEGNDRPEWLPPTASDVFHRSRGGFGWLKVAEFTITETELRAYASERGWILQEKSNYRPPGIDLLKPTSKPYSEQEFFASVIPRALVYQRLASNNGGITFAFDPSTSRAYYLETHR